MVDCKVILSLARLKMAAKAEATKRYLTKIDDPLASKYYRGWVECLDYLEENGYLCSRHKNVNLD